MSVIAASNYLAYLIGRKQVTYEELRRQVGLFGQFVEQKRVEEEKLELAAPKQRQERFEQNGSALTGLTTSTTNGKILVAPEPAVAKRPVAASLTDDTAVAPPGREVQPPKPPLNVATKHLDMHSVIHQRAARRQKASPTSALPRKGSGELAGAERSSQLTTATPATPDASLAGQ